MTHSDPNLVAAGYLLDREELLRIRQLKLLTSDRDYIFFALQIDFPSKLNPTLDIQRLTSFPFVSAGS